MSRFVRGEVDGVYRFRAEFENLISACPCGGIGRRVGLKIQSGLNLGASSSLAKGRYFGRFNKPPFLMQFITYILIFLFFLYSFFEILLNTSSKLIIGSNL